MSTTLATIKPGQPGWRVTLRVRAGNLNQAAGLLESVDKVVSSFNLIAFSFPVA